MNFDLNGQRVKISTGQYVRIYVGICVEISWVIMLLMKACGGCVHGCSVRNNVYIQVNIQKLISNITVIKTIHMSQCSLNKYRYINTEKLASRVRAY